MAKGSAIKAGEAFVELALRGKEKVMATLKNVSKRVKTFAVNVAKVGAAAAGAAATTALALAKNAADAGDKIHKMGIRTGASAEFLSQLGFAAEQSGTDLETVGKVMQRMNRRLGRATAIGGPAADAMRELGLSLEEIENMSPEQRFLAIADAMAKHGDQAEAAGLAQRAFGAQVDKLLPLLLSGKEGIQGMMQEADMLGRTISGDQADASAAFADSMNRLKSVLQGVAVQLGQVLVPTITVWMDELLAAIRVMSGASESTGELTGKADGLGSMLSGLASPVTFIIRGFKFLAGVFKLVQGSVTTAGAAIAKFVELAASAATVIPGIGDAAKQTAEVAKAINQDLNKLASEQFDAARENFDTAFSSELSRKIEAERRKLAKMREDAAKNAPPLFDPESLERAERAQQKATQQASAAASTTNLQNIGTFSSSALDRIAANQGRTEQQQLNVLQAIRRGIIKLGDTLEGTFEFS